MFGIRRMEILLIGGVLTALPVVIAAQTTVPADRLVQRYAVLAGSEENARNLVTGLRDGTDITLSGDPAGPVTVTNPTSKMGYGNVNITLALAEQQLSAISNPGPADLSNALTNAENGVLTLRAQGTGWGEIAHAFGFKLGDVMRASATGESPGAANRAERAAPQRVARGSSADDRRPDILRHGFERPQKAERPEKPERPQRPERGSR